MKLIKAHVTDFRSVEDSGEFTLDQTTCLVGKNEAGKSAILLALAALNPHPLTPVVLDKERDYPRRFLNDYDDRHTSTTPATAVTTTWKLEPDEIAEITAKFGPGALKSEEVVVLRRYGETGPRWLIDIDAKKAIANFLAEHGVTEEHDVLPAASDFPDLLKLLTSNAERSEAENKAHAALSGRASALAEAEKLLVKYLPKFMYFASYDRMAAIATIEQLQQAQANATPQDEIMRSQKLFAEFFDYANVPLKEVVAASTFEIFNSKLQSASNKVTDQILEYWTQNVDLEVQIRIDQGKPSDPAPYNNGQIARARIYNQLHRADTPFSERSAGFVWFFSFLVKFGLIERGDAKVVLLLDEPGLTLHGKAQADLLRFFAEKLAPTHQLIYSTHSPFMVPHDNLLSCRVVEDKVIERAGKRRTPTGTKVSGDILLHDKDTIFPLQGALGYEISQSLFVGKHTLLVEGPSDILYLHALSNELKRRKRIFLDERWTICPSGGIDKISAFISLFSGNGLDIAVLTDLATGDKTKLEKLRKSEILNAGRLYTASDFTGKTEADIEDLLEPEVYCALVNAAHAVPADKILTPAILASATPATPRIMKQAETVFRVIGEFSHYAPAYWLITHPDVLADDSAANLATLERAEKVFTTFNALLPSLR